MPALEIFVSDSVVELIREAQKCYKATKLLPESRLVNCLLRFGCRHLVTKFEGQPAAASQTIRRYYPETEGDTSVKLAKIWTPEYRETFQFINAEESFENRMLRANICDAILRFTITEFDRPRVIESIYSYHRKALRKERKDNLQLLLPLSSEDYVELTAQVGLEPEIFQAQTLSPDSLTTLTRFFVKFLESVRKLNAAEFEQFAKSCIERATQLESRRSVNDTFLLLEGVDADVISKFDGFRGQTKLNYLLRGVASVAVRQRQRNLL